MKLIRKNLCCGCGGCSVVCPRSAIIIKMDHEGFLYPHLMTESCIECGLCLKICPINQKNAAPSYSEKCYAAYSKNKSLRLKSSSGGVFGELALSVLRKSGIIYGVAMKQADYAYHKRISDEKELTAILGSKYLPSHIENTFELAKKDLNSKKLLLFSGTPCQIAALKSFLGKNYENLITCEVICHGVPSEKVWHKYLTEITAETSLADAQCVSFRDKEYGWESCQLCIAGNSPERVAIKIKEKHRENIFFKVFLSNLCLRPSCYRCQFRNGISGADISLGDFWGIEKFYPDLNTKDGISAVVVRSEKGVSLLQNIKNELYLQEVSLTEIVAGNPCYLSSSAEPTGRKYFMKNFGYRKLDDVYSRSIRQSLLHQISRKTKDILKKIFL